MDQAQVWRHEWRGAWRGAGGRLAVTWNDPSVCGAPRRASALCFVAPFAAGVHATAVRPGSGGDRMMLLMYRQRRLCMDVPRVDCSTDEGEVCVDEAGGRPDPSGSMGCARCVSVALCVGAVANAQPFVFSRIIPACVHRCRVCALPPQTCTCKKYVQSIVPPTSVSYMWVPSGYHAAAAINSGSRALRPTEYATSFRVGSHTTRPPARVWLCFGWLSLCFVCVFVVRVSSTLLFVLCVCSSCVCVHCAVEGKKIGDRCYPRSSAGARRSS